MLGEPPNFRLRCRVLAAARRIFGTLDPNETGGDWGSAATGRGEALARGRELDRAAERRYMLQDPVISTEATMEGR